jgi:hypothetical protein
VIAATSTVEYSGVLQPPGTTEGQYAMNGRVLAYRGRAVSCRARWTLDDGDGKTVHATICVGKPAAFPGVRADAKNASA